MLGIVAVLYAAYALSLKRWDYDTEAKRNARRARWKEQGLTNTFYFIHAGTLFCLNLASGGLFTFYWLFRQWQAVSHGFRRLDGKPLRGGAWVRALGGFISFFPLNALICRTCAYLRHTAPLPPWVWGTLWLGGLAGTLASPSAAGRIIGYLFFCGAPAVLQRRLNALPNQPISASPRPREILAALGALACAAALAAAIRVWM